MKKVGILKLVGTKKVFRNQMILIILQKTNNMFNSLKAILLLVLFMHGLWLRGQESSALNNNDEIEIMLYNVPKIGLGGSPSKAPSAVNSNKVELFFQMHIEI